MLKKTVTRVLRLFGCALLVMAPMACSGGGDGGDDADAERYMTASRIFHPDKFLNGTEIVWMTFVGNDDFKYIKKIKIHCDPAPAGSDTTTADVELTIGNYVGTHEATIKVEQGADSLSPVLILDFKPFTNTGNGGTTDMQAAIGLVQVSDLGNDELDMVMAWAMDNGTPRPDAASSCTDTSKDGYKGPLIYDHYSNGYENTPGVTGLQYVNFFFSNGTFVTSTLIDPA